MRSVPPSEPHKRASLTAQLGKTTIVFYAVDSDDRGRRTAKIRIDNHPLVVVTILRSGLVHWADRPGLKPVADKLEVPLLRLTAALRDHARAL